MSYSNENTAILYDGNGSDKTFAINFEFLDSAQVKAELWDVTDPDNPTKTDLTAPTHFSVSGSDVVMVTAPTADEKLLVYRDTVPVHETLYSSYTFPYSTVNNDFDRVYQIAQENRAWLERSLGNSLFDYLSNGGTTTISITELDAQVTKNTNDISSLESGQITQNGRLAQNESDIFALQAEQITQNGRLNGHDMDISALQSEQITQNGRIAQNESDIFALQTLSSNNFSKNTTQDGTLANHEQRISSLEEGTYGGLQDQIDTLNIEQGVQDGRLDGHDSDVMSLQNQINSLGITLNAHDVRLDANTADISDNDADILALQIRVDALAAAVAALQEAGGTGWPWQVDTENADFTAVFGRLHAVDTTGGAVVCTLPSPLQGIKMAIKWAAGSNPLTIVPSGTELIEGSTSGFVLTSHKQSVNIVSDGTDWFIF